MQIMNDNNHTIAVRAHSGLTVTTEAGEEILVRSGTLNAEVQLIAERESGEEWGNECVLLKKQILVDGRTLTHDSAFSPEDLLRLMPLQTCQLSIERMIRSDRFELVELCTVTFASDSRKAIWMPVQVGEANDWPEFYCAHLKYFGAKFTILGARDRNEPHGIARLWGRMSEDVLTTAQRSKVLSQPVFFQIEPTFLIFHNRLRRRPLNEDGSKATYTAATGPAESKTFEYAPWMLSEIPMPVLWKDTNTHNNKGSSRTEERSSDLNDG